MRVTNSMLVNNFMRNLNNNLVRMDKLQNQLATGRKYAHISDDPIALIFGQAARNKIARLEHYQRAVQSAQQWLEHVETSVMELQGRVADIYTEVVNVATDVKGAADKNDIAMLIAQLRDHYVDTLNSTFGDRYMFAGYNTPGEASLSGPVTGPYKFENGSLIYNGYNLTELAKVDDINVMTARIANLNNEVDEGMKSLMNDYAWITGFDLPANYDGSFDINGPNEIVEKRAVLVAKLGTLDPSNPDYLDPEDPNYYVERARLTEELAVVDAEMVRYNDSFQALKEKWDKRAEALKEFEALNTVVVDTNPSDTGSPTTVDNIDVSYNAATGLIDGLAVDVDGAATVLLQWETDPILGTTIMAATRLEYDDFTDLLDRLQSDVLIFDVGPSVSMPVTFNGLDLILYETVAEDGKTIKRNIFSLMDDLTKAAASGNPAEQLGSYIKELQDAQNHLLTKVAEVGGRTRRLDLLEARYDQNMIMYEKMRSDAEDVDMAEVIMYQKMAEAVYQAALSAGARIIQPTLMDFLR